MRVSVVTPSFNQEAFVRATLESVMSQGFDGLEYVVIDGGSTDGSAEIIKEHASSLAHWVSEPDNGLYHALNKGFARTTGEVMAWLNSSDLHYPWTLTTVAEIFTQLPDVQWIMGLPTQFAATGARGPKSVSSSQFNVYDVLAGDYRWVQQESVFWRRSLWERAGGRLDDSLRFAADLDLWLRFFRLAPLHHVGTVLAGWRVHEDQLGQFGHGGYAREADKLVRQFASDAGALRRAKARVVHWSALRRPAFKAVPDALHRLGLLPWYEHPLVVFDFGKGTWTVR